MAAQTGLCLAWSETRKDRFSHDKAHFVSGYRHFPLFDKNGEQFEQGVMFVHVKIDDPPQ